jgi:hypothetical protein
LTVTLAHNTVIPAKAGIFLPISYKPIGCLLSAQIKRIPAFARMTEWGRVV